MVTMLCFEMTIPFLSGTPVLLKQFVKQCCGAAPLVEVDSTLIVPVSRAFYLPLRLYKGHASFVQGKMFMCRTHMNIAGHKEAAGPGIVHETLHRTRYPHNPQGNSKRVILVAGAREKASLQPLATPQTVQQPQPMPLLYSKSAHQDAVTKAKESGKRSARGANVENEQARWTPAPLSATQIPERDGKAIRDLHHPPGAGHDARVTILHPDPLSSTCDGKRAPTPTIRGRQGASRCHRLTMQVSACWPSLNSGPGPSASHPLSKPSHQLASHTSPVSSSQPSLHPSVASPSGSAGHISHLGSYNTSISAKLTFRPDNKVRCVLVRAKRNGWLTKTEQAAPSRNQCWNVRGNNGSDPAIKRRIDVGGATLVCACALEWREILLVKQNEGLAQNLG